MKLFSRLMFLWVLGGAIYCSIEMLFRNHTHSSMFVLGGACFILIGLINELFPWEMYIELQTLIGAAIVTVLEFLTGCIVNIMLGLEVWDYSNMPLNLLGQICVPFILLWIPLVLVAILLDDHIRYKMFFEEKPRYTSWIIKKLKKN